MKRKYEDITKDPHFIESGLCPPFIKSLNISNPQRDEHLIDILSTGTFNFKSNLTSLYMIPTDYKFHVKDDRSQEYLPQSLLNYYAHMNIGFKIKQKYFHCNLIFYHHP